MVLHADNHFDPMTEHLHLKCESFVNAVRKYEK
jgi:hypothetical protein